MATSADSSCGGRRCGPGGSLEAATAALGLRAHVPLLSVVTPIYNAGKYLSECLDSVARLGVNHEHVGVDGGSTDGTVELLRAREDPALRWVSKPDRGQTHAVN